jgi:ribonucleotide monophosphatase NagD (HAD superfamily)
MIGDDAASDVGGALKAGLQGILVRTGKYRPGDEKLLEGRGEVAEDVGEAVARVLEQA